MTALLDTHAFLWLLGDTSRLSPAANSVLSDKSNRLLLSIASAWELAIKLSIKKLTLAEPLDQLLMTSMKRASVELEPLARAHVVAVAGLPFHHRDPFDRMLVAHCLIDSLPIVSADANLDVYGIRRIW